MPNTLSGKKIKYLPKKKSTKRTTTKKKGKGKKMY